ncbi:unnamed protein product [Didymodactylos carnosus]|uniref:Uncharacterized protein n=1 Tax=Didymodactylos carnosus TaxID=1234261 RepID=A0A815X711_9BILA|nr:unnamed protein product [Didymodactylos carnosus]CAF4414791.1 unnamed protein product [Didymodactylos carnosus]
MHNSNLIRLFEDLSVTPNENRLQILERINIELSIITTTQFEQIHQNIPWQLLFELVTINTNNDDEYDRLLCSIFDLFIVNLSVENIISDFYPLLYNGLKNPEISNRIKLLCLKALDKLSKCQKENCFHVIKQLFQHEQIYQLLKLFLDKEQQNLWIK